MKMKVIEVETEIKKKLYKLPEQLNQRHNRAEVIMDFVVDCVVGSEKQDLSTQFLQMQKSQSIDLQEHVERYRIVLPVYGISSTKYDLNLFKSFLLLILVNERDIERQL